MTTALTTTQTINAGDYGLVPTGTTDERLVDMWLHSGRRAGSPNTQAQYMRVWRQFSAFVQLPLQAVTLADLQAWQQSLTGKPATVKVKVSAIRSLFAFAYKTGYLRANPAVMLDAGNVKDTKHRKVASELDILRMLDVARTPRIQALVHVLYSSGARVSEVLQLTWQDVQPRSNGGAVLYIVYGKGGKQREAGISTAAYEALSALRDEDTQDTDYVFSTAKGTALDRHAAHRMLKETAKRAELSDDFSAHWLRHSHVSHAIAKGANMEAVRQQVGHSSLTVTTSYAHADSYSADVLTL